MTVEQPTIEDVVNRCKVTGEDLRTAMAELGSDYAWYWYDKTPVVWHVTDEASVEAILRDGLRCRPRFAFAGSGRGIFFLSRRDHASEPLIGIDRPVVLEIDKAGVEQPGTTTRHDNHENDWNLAALYTTADWIPPKFIRRCEK